MDMASPFGATWGTLSERCEDLPEDATLITPLSTRRFCVAEIQQQRIIIEDNDLATPSRFSAHSSKCSPSTPVTRLVSDDPEAEVFRQEIDRLEHKIEELTEFSPGSAFADGAKTSEQESYKVTAPIVDAISLSDTCGEAG